MVSQRPKKGIIRQKSKTCQFHMTLACGWRHRQCWWRVFHHAWLSICHRFLTQSGWHWHTMLRRIHLCCTSYISFSDYVHFSVKYQWKNFSLLIQKHISTKSCATVACLFSAMLHAWTLKSQQTRPCSWWWTVMRLSLIHIWRCRRSTLCRSRWSPYH